MGSDRSGYRGCGCSEASPDRNRGWRRRCLGGTANTTCTLLWPPRGTCCSCRMTALQWSYRRAHTSRYEPLTWRSPGNTGQVGGVERRIAVTVKSASGEALLVHHRPPRGERAIRRVRSVKKYINKYNSCACRSLPQHAGQATACTWGDDRSYEGMGITTRRRPKFVFCALYLRPSENIAVFLFCRNSLFLNGTGIKCYFLAIYSHKWAIFRDLTQETSGS